MRIHTNLITGVDIYAATHNLPGVTVTATEHGSRSHARAFEVRLEGNGSHRNSGRYGADTAEQAATWDEWGAFLSALYEIDPNALWGSQKHPVYRDRAHYHYLTNWRFIEDVDPGFLPSDTHKRHNWQWDASGAQCSKCSARQMRRY